MSTTKHPDLEFNQVFRQMVQPSFERSVDKDAFVFSGELLPAAGVGNDFFDVIEKDNGDLIFFSCDVPGQHYDSAIYASIALATLRAIATQSDSIFDMAHLANEQLSRYALAGLYLKCFLGRFHLQSSALSYVNAGHSKLALRLNQGLYEFVESDIDLAFGIDSNYLFKEQHISFDKQDELMLISQTVMDQPGMSEESVLGLMNRKNISVIQHLKSELNQKESDRQTDLVLLHLKVKERLMGIGTQLKVHFRNDISELAKLKDVVTLFGQANDISQDIQLNMNLALEECITNTIFYGYQDHDSHLIYVGFEVKDQQLMVIIEDDGVAFDPLNDAPSHDDSASLDDMVIGGLGIKFVTNIMDDVSYRREDHKNILSLMIRLNKEESEL